MTYFHLLGILPALKHSSGWSSGWENIVEYVQAREPDRFAFNDKANASVYEAYIRELGYALAVGNDNQTEVSDRLMRQGSQCIR